MRIADFLAQTRIAASTHNVTVPTFAPSASATTHPQGIALSGLDSSYVSGLSLYFIAQQAIPRLLALAPPLRRVFAAPLTAGAAFAGGSGSSGPDPDEEARLAAMAAGMGPMGMSGAPGAPGAAWLAKSAFKAEAGALGLATFASALVEGEAAIAAEGRAAMARRR